MSGFLSILVSAALVNNLVLVQLLGVSSLFRGFARIADAAILAMFTAVVLIVTALLNYLLFTFVLTPLNITALQLVSLVVITGTCTLVLQKKLADWFPGLSRHHLLTLFMVAGNSAVVGVSLLTVRASYSLSETMAYSLGAALGFGAILIFFAALRERLATSPVPPPFKGLAIELISAGLAAMALLGLAGVI
ncbi:MAG: Rnf-Nqr domain containing protein [Pseudohongiellaceae bacterium]